MVVWWEHNQFQQQKLMLDRERIGIALRQAGEVSAKIQQSLKLNKSSVEDDINAPHELSGEAELAQAKLWHSLPKDKRAIMQIETINTGLAASPHK